MAKVTNLSSSQMKTADGRKLQQRLSELASIKAPVDGEGDLPLSASLHDRIFVKALGKEFLFNGTSWQSMSGVTSTKRAISFYLDDTLAAETSAAIFVAPMALTVQKVSLYAEAAPMGSDLIVDINKNGTTMFTTQTLRPKVTAGSHSGTSLAPDVKTIVEGDRISIDIDQVGSATPGNNLAVTIHCVEV